MVTVGIVVGTALPSAAAGGPAPIEQRNDKTVTADPIPTVQIDSGIVWAQVINGDTVYAGGSFSNARPAGAAAGTDLMPRSNLLAYNIDTGVATSFAPTINGTVKALALSPDGSRLYVGGSFTSVDGQVRYNLAAFDTTTGALLNDFKPAIGGSYVNAIVATGDTVYVGGLIGAAKGVLRNNLAAVTSSGALLGWAPTTDLQVDAMVLNPQGDKIIIGGRFSTVNGATQRGLAALDMTTGSVLPWAVTATVKNGWGTGSGKGKAGIFGLTTDSTGAVFGTGWVYATVTEGNLEGLFAAEGEDGAIRWIADCHGDHYGVYSDGTNVYSTGHEHECTTAGGLAQGTGTMRNATVYTSAAKGTLTRSPYVSSIYADWSGYPAPAAVNWYPDWTTGTASGSGQAGWDVTGNGKYVVIGGEFPYVNGQRSQGIARFAVNPPGGPKQAPRVSGDDWVPTARSVSAGTARIQIPANWDRDDLNLTYELWEQGASKASATETSQATFWNRPTQTLTAKGLTPGSSHTFYVIAKDGDGNTAKSASVTVTVSSAAASAYADEVLGDGASLYWRLGGDASIGGSDWAGTNDATWAAGVSDSADAALLGETDASAKFSGQTTGYGSTTSTASVGSSFAVELWFKTTTTSGGKLVGYGSSSTGTSSSYDRHVYMTNDGRLVFGVYPGSVKTVQSSAAYNDGSWHYVVAEQSATDGMQLYVDGQLVASDASVTTAQSYTGYWRLGGDNLSGWTNVPSSYWFNGTLDEFAVYPSVLTADQVSSHYAVAKDVGSPTADFTVDGSDLAWSVDGSGSTAPAGRTITNYAWNFGDGATATAETASHTYSAAGTYTVTLTITDSLGLVSSTTHTVTATEPHVAPVASFTADVSGLSVAVDASASAASDGATVTGYSWDFGDGEQSTESSSTHAYSNAGKYTITLTVTDSDGASSAAVTKDVTVSHSDPEASFSAAPGALSVQVDASSSKASDGADLAYAWDWGDGSDVGTGKTASHTYASAGTYTITLTLTDSLNATATVSHDVAIADKAFAVRDDFDRTVTSGWGTATVGGDWSSANGLSVADGVGKISLGSGKTISTSLSTVSVQDVDATAQVSFAAVPDAGSLHFNLDVHKSGDNEYRLKARVTSTGTVAVSVAKVVSNTETLLSTANISKFTLTAGGTLDLHLVTSTAGGSTTLKANVWPSGTDEPSGWLVSATDATTTLQSAGAVGVLTYLSSSASNGPIVISLDNLAVTDVDSSPHSAPIANIAASASGLTVQFDASGSQTSDGATLAGYAWDFGDGDTSTKAAPSHTYAVAGKRTVTLVVTDSRGASSAAVTKDVTVSHSDPEASFSAAPGALSVQVDASSSKASDGADLAYAWDWGDGSDVGTGKTASHTYASAGTYTITLTLTDSLNATATVSHDVAIADKAFAVRDDFDRTVTSGWGTATVGGDWSSANGLSVADGVGKISLGSGKTISTSLSTVSVQDVDATAQVSFAAVPDAGSLHFNLDVHKSGDNEYRLKARVTSTGTVAVSVAKVVSNTETLLSTANISKFTLTAGGTLDLHLVTSTAGGSTTLKANVWPSGTDEPSGWLVSATDATTTLQSAGAVGVLTYLSSSASNGPIVISLDNLAVIDPTEG
ncbi:PKD domain-containing protein [Microbacterium sp. KR10-403]|uniref:PKD domain-containing protein n=1 Tax=Microbacterium sp. KR10-403 TaxID=3158581 RepID=UPI0032E44E8F